MDKKVLVAYATKYGATQEIAERVGQLLQEAGFNVDVRPIKQVSELEAYNAIVLGSAVYAGQWRQEAADFLRVHQQYMAEHPTWLFSSGPTSEGDPVEAMKGWRFPAELQPVADRIQPLDIAFFGGKLDPEQLNFAERLIIKAMKAPTGDYRGWDEIEAWASSIVEVLKKQIQ